MNPAQLAEALAKLKSLKETLPKAAPKAPESIPNLKDLLASKLAKTTKAEIRVWKREYKFKIGAALSSTDISLIKES